MAELPLGTIAVDSLSPDFTNPVGTVIQHSYWTTVPTKYLYAQTQGKYVVRSIPAHDCRDMEVTASARRMVMFLRLDASGNAIYFDFDGETAKGVLVIGIVIGLNETSYEAGTYYKLYQCDTIPGYDKSDITGDSLTFGVRGFDIYAKFNSSEFVRFQEYRHMAVGGMAIKTNTAGPYGISNDVTYTILSEASLFSNYQAHELDLRDFKWRSIKTTGSIAAGSNSLTVATSAGLLIGDYVVIEIGKEAGQGQRGTVGVGGVWPALSYANKAAMDADTSQPPNRFAWTRDTGATYWWTGPTPQPTWYPPNKWIGQEKDEGLEPAHTYYLSKALPRSLKGRITEITGNVLTLDTAATVSTTDANVYLDNSLYLNYFTANDGARQAITPDDITIVLPAGIWYGAGRLYCTSKPGWTIRGMGEGVTTLQSIKGAEPCSWNIQNCHGLKVRDFTWNGNLGHQQYGMAWGDGRMPDFGLGTALVPDGQIRAINDYAGLTEFSDPSTVIAGSAHPRGGVDITGCNDAECRDLTITEAFMCAVGFHGCGNAWGYNCTATRKESVPTYIQWQLQHDMCGGGGFQDCMYSSPYMSTAYEAFNCAGTQYVRCASINGYWSCNDVGDFHFEDCTATTTALSGAPGSSINNPLLNISGNTGTSNVHLGGHINNFTFVVERIDENNNQPCGIIINNICPNVSVAGGSYSGPDWLAPATTMGPCGIRSTGPNTQVSNFRCCGQVRTPISIHSSNIGVEYGGVTNCVADSIALGAGATGSGNTRPTG